MEEVEIEISSLYLYELPCAALPFGAEDIRLVLLRAVSAGKAPPLEFIRALGAAWAPPLEFPKVSGAVRAAGRGPSGEGEG